MNVAEILEEVGDALASPARNDHIKRSRKRKLNRVYQRDILANKVWPFLIKTVEHEVFKDRTFGTADSDYGSGATVTLGATNYDGTLNGMTWPRSFGGNAWLVLAGPTGLSSALDPFFPDEYKLQVGAVKDVTYNQISLVEPAPAAFSTYAGTVRFYNYVVPKDCRKILALFDRNTLDGKLRYLTRAREATISLKHEDTAGLPTQWMQDDVRTVEPPRTLTATAYSSGGGSLAGTYRYCMTNVFKGMESGRGPIVEVTVDGANDAVQLDFEATEPGAADLNMMTRKIYRADPGSDLFKLLPNEENGTSITRNDTGASDPLPYDYYDSSGTRETFRVHPRPSEDTVLHLQYLKKPRLLQHDTDVPELPEPFHDLLVHGMVVLLGASMEGRSDLVDLHSRLFKEGMRALEHDSFNELADDNLRRMWEPVTTSVRARAGDLEFTG